ncbi:FAD-dependent pyridine nucleotide-disulfide oxidoreductase [Pseudohyphozyma bogoriensis]|nr:FAD-dependent pyridine nucleotide-disulfide oxidoreductase [Pseudohyphozyma bogoriensis]
MSSTSAAPTSDLKNVVIVGLGLSGAPTANSLASSLPPSHRLVCISATESAYYPPAALRGGTSPAVELKKHSVVVDKAFSEFGLGSEIEFEYAVLAMGSEYPAPCRPINGQSSIPEVSNALRALQADIARSSSLLVVGGGPVGIEFSGEVSYLYPEKKVTLVHSRASFLDDDGFKKSLGESLLGQLQKMGVEVVFNAKLDTGELGTGKIEEQEFDLGGGRKVQCDFLFKAYGNSPATSLLSPHPDLLNDAKRVRVRPSLQLDSDDFSHIFAVGDITDIAESKQWAHAEKHGPVVASNIVSLINDPSTTNLKRYSAAAPLIAVS